MTATTHRIEATGQYCECGQDAFICQKCGQPKCGATQHGSWTKQTGNICKSCN